MKASENGLKLDKKKNKKVRNFHRAKKKKIIDLIHFPECVKSSRFSREKVLPIDAQLILAHMVWHCVRYRMFRCKARELHTNEAHQMMLLHNLAKEERTGLTGTKTEQSLIKLIRKPYHKSWSRSSSFHLIELLSNQLSQQKRNLLE